ncbi:Uncharacterised protein [uncultured Clostridium sp.]|nr:Uncharacterised protein [uncultured Clostridium sp.]
MQMNKSYYAIIPANVRYDEDLTPNAKLLYGEITALCNEKGYCWASNDYFAELYKTSNRTVSRWIQQLISKGHITSKLIYREGTKEVKERHLYIGLIGGDKNVTTYRQKCHEGIDKNVATPIDKNVQDNNTSINNTFNNTTTIDKDVVADMIKKYFDFTEKEINQIKKVFLEKNVGIDYLEEKLELTKNNPNIKNVIGYLINAIQKDYKVSINDAKCFIPRVKTRFHNINQTFTNYSPDELEKLLMESQKGKFDKTRRD